MAAPKWFRFYKDQPVKRMRVGPDGIILTMLSAVKGEEGLQHVITQAEWNVHGEWRAINAVRMDDVRVLAAMT